MSTSSNYNPNSTPSSSDAYFCSRLREIQQEIDLVTNQILSTKIDFVRNTALRTDAIISYFDEANPENLVAAHEAQARIRFLEDALNRLMDRERFLCLQLRILEIERMWSAVIDQYQVIIEELNGSRPIAAEQPVCKPQAIKFNELADQGRELQFENTVREVENSCRAINRGTWSSQIPIAEQTEQTENSSSVGVLIDSSSSYYSSTSVEEDQSSEGLPSSNSGEVTPVPSDPSSDICSAQFTRTSALYDPFQPYYDYICLNDIEEVPQINSEEQRSGTTTSAGGLGMEELSQHQPPTTPPALQQYNPGDEGESSSFNPTGELQAMIDNWNNLQDQAAVVDQNFGQADSLYRCNPFVPTLHNFMQARPQLPLWSQGSQNTNIGSSIGANVLPLPIHQWYPAIQPERLSPPAPRAFMGNMGLPAMMQNLQYPSSSSNYYGVQRAGMEPSSHIPMEGTSSGRPGKRKMSTNGPEPDEVSSLPAVRNREQAQAHYYYNPMLNLHIRSDYELSAYDPTYDQLGLAVDPHVRAFHHFQCNKRRKQQYYNNLPRY